jgi:hypothetical protein
VELRVADHLAADNDGKPELVAELLRRFFLGAESAKNLANNDATKYINGTKKGG